MLSDSGIPPILPRSNRGVTMVTTDTRESVTMSDFGETARLRRERLRATQDEVADAAGVNRDTVGAVEAGKGSNRSRGKIDDALSAMEAEAGLTGVVPLGPPQVPSPATSSENAPKVVRIEVPNMYGGDAIIVEGPIEHPEVLEAMVDRLMRKFAVARGELDEPIEPVEDVVERVMRRLAAEKDAERGEGE
jgi:transcriptional regulator with XRE-family HTH domain